MLDIVDSSIYYWISFGYEVGFVAKINNVMKSELLVDCSEGDGESGVEVLEHYWDADGVAGASFKSGSKHTSNILLTSD